LGTTWKPGCAARATTSTTTCNGWRNPSIMVSRSF
jgi:hypothetical protein